jgi:signal transduction histidine kinase
LQSQSQSPVGVLIASLNLSSDGIVVFEPVFGKDGALIDMRIELMNDAAVKIFNIPREVAYGSLLTQIWNIEPEDPGFDNVRKVIASGEPIQYEWYTDNLGTRRWFEIALRPFGDRGLAALYHETTEKRRYIEELESQKSFYEHLILQSPSRKTILRPLRNEAGEIEDFLCDYVNYGPGIDDRHRNLSPFESSIKDQKLSHALPSYKQTEVWGLCCSVADSGTPRSLELHYKADGKDTLALLTAQAMPDGRVYVSTTDVSESRRLATELDKERQQLDAVLREIPLGITVFEAVRDENGELKDLRLVRRNEKALSLSRIPADIYNPGALLSELMPKELSENFEMMLDVVRTGNPIVHELYQPHLDKWISSRINKYGDGILSTIQDITDLKRHSEEIRQQAELLNGILETSPVATVVYAPEQDEDRQVTDFRPIIANKQAIEFSGLAADAFMKLTLFQRRDDKATLLPELCADIRTQRQHAYEQQLPSGRWIHSVTTPFGEGFIATTQDITTQKNVTQKIEESIHLLNAVLDASPISIVVYESIRDTNGAIQDFRPIIANKKAMQLSNFSPDVFLQRTFFERFSGERDTLMPQLSKVVNERIARYFEWQVPTTGYWVSSSATPFGDGFIATSLDITEQKRQSAQIGEQAQLFHGVLDSLQNGLSIFRMIRNEAGELEDLEYLEVARSVERDTGRTREAIIGKRITELFPGIHTTEYWSAYKEVANTRKPVSFEIHFTLPGYDNYLVNTVSPLGEDKLVSVYYIVNDLKKAQLELEHTVHELRRSNEDLEQFASIASHDLQEPLRKVESFGAMLESRYAEALGEQGRDLLQRMQNAASRMRNLVSGLLAFARLSGEEDLPLLAVDLNGLLTDILTDLDETIKATGGHVHIQSRLPFVQGQESQLRHLFYNLMTNALKFAKEDVAPEIKISHSPLVPGDEKRLSPLASKEHYVRLEMTDNGIGFEQEFAERIFGLFERLHGIGQYKGTGLGLSICRRVAERHEGAIWAESQPGQGAKFIVLLKLA